MPAFGRILLKLSGEALMGDLEYGTDPERVRSIASQVASVRERGVEIAIVVGAVLGKHLPERVIKYGAAALFAIFGLVLIAEGLGWF